eukprot:UN24201
MYNISPNDHRSFWSFLCLTLNTFVTSTRHFVVGGGILHEFCFEISIIYSSLHLCLSATMECSIASFCILILFIPRFIEFYSASIFRLKMFVYITIFIIY